MSPARIRRRATAKGTRYQVVYRRGGRGFNVESAGTFRTEREAKIRRDLVAGWLAAGKNPRTELAALLAPAVPTRTYRQWAEAYRTSRIDIDENTRHNLESHLKRLLDLFGDRDPAVLTVSDQIEAVAKLTVGLKASSVRRYWATHRQILDFAGVDPNPARDAAVKMPRVEQAEIEPPTRTEIDRLLTFLPARYHLPVRVLEQTGMRVGELERLEWRDVDQANLRVRVRHGKTAAARRWVLVPEWVMREIDATCAPDDRAGERRVFSGVTPDAMKNAMARACVAAGMRHLHPHDLRHRYISVQLARGVPGANIAAQVGHSRTRVTHEVYEHVLLPEEP